MHTKHGYQNQNRVVQISSIFVMVSGSHLNKFQMGPLASLNLDSLIFTDRQLVPAVFRIADDVRTDIGDRPCWTMPLSGPSFLQKTTSASRRSVRHVTKEI